MPEKSAGNHLNVTVIRFEGKFAVLQTDDQQELRWPIKLLPDEVQEHSTLRLRIASGASEREEQEELARAVINKILST